MRNAAETIAPAAAVRSISREYRVAGSESSRLPDRELLSATDVFDSHRNFFPRPSITVVVMRIALRLADDCRGCTITATSVTRDATRMGGEEARRRRRPLSAQSRRLIARRVNVKGARARSRRRTWQQFPRLNVCRTI